MICECSQLPEIVRLGDHPNIEQKAEQLETGDWVRLVRCLICGQLWSVDEWDKYQRQFAIKIPQQDGWRQYDTTPSRVDFLIQSRGGLTDELCIWTNCKSRRVRGVVYCAKHLFKTGARDKVISHLEIGNKNATIVA
jgi:hypothetical protein